MRLNSWGGGGFVASLSELSFRAVLTTTFGYRGKKLKPLQASLAGVDAIVDSAANG